MMFFFRKLDKRLVLTIPTSAGFQLSTASTGMIDQCTYMVCELFVRRTVEQFRCHRFCFCQADVMIVAFPFIVGQHRLDINEVHAGSTIASAQARPISTREKGGIYVGIPYFVALAP